MNILPYLSMGTGSFLYVLEAVILKKYKHMSLIHQLFIISLSAVVPSLLVILYYNHKNKDKKFELKHLLTNKNRILVGFVMAGFFLSTYNGYRILPASLSYPIFMSVPLAILVMSQLINKEEVSIWQYLFAGISLLGVIIVTMSKTKIDNRTLYLGVISMIIGMICYALAYTLTKPSKKRVFLKHAALEESKEIKDKPIIEKINMNLLDIFTIPFIIFSILSVLILYLPKNIIQQLPKSYQSNKGSFKEVIFLFVLFILLNYGHNLGFFYTYNNVSLPIYGALENFNILASLVIGYFVLREKVTFRKLFGCLVILAGVLLNVRYELKHKKKN